MRREYMTLATAIALLAITGCGCERKELATEGKRRSDEEIIKAANQVAVAEELSLDTMSRVYCDPDNREWKETLAEMAESYPDPEFVERYGKLLKGRSYQAVWYVSDVSTIFTSGRFCVFVDKRTGKVIGFCGGI